TPTMTPSSARLWLRSRARTDTYTGGVVPSDTWGYGKLDLEQSTTGVDGANLARFSFAAPFPNPSRDFAPFQCALAAGDLADPSAPAEVRVLNVAGREIRTIQAARVPGTQRISWNGLDENGASAPPGVYFAQLVVGKLHATRKFVRIA